MWQTDVQPTIQVGSPLFPSQRYVAVYLLTNQCLNFVVEVKSRTCELLNNVIEYLAMEETSLFGLALFSDGEFLFLDPDTKLSKYSSKAWKSSRNVTSNLICKNFDTVFRASTIKINHCSLNNIARHHYYLQLRENVIRQMREDNMQRYFTLASLALQADLGDYCADTHNTPYFIPGDYFPPSIVNEVGFDYIRRRVPLLHGELRGVSRWEAEFRYIKESSFAHNAHFYPLRSKKEDSQPSVLIGISTKGIEIYEIRSTQIRMHKTTLSWSNIVKLTFEIRVAGDMDAQRSVYFASSDTKAKHLLYLCRITHLYSLATIQKLQEMRLPERSGSTRSDHRISLVSSISSNTTSGIVADKPQTTDDSEDDLEIEILLKSPPAASLESLTLSDLEGRRDDPKSCKRSPKKLSEDTPTPRPSSIPAQEDDYDEEENGYNSQYARCSLSEPHLYKACVSEDEDDDEVPNEAVLCSEDHALTCCCNCPVCEISDSEDEENKASILSVQPKESDNENHHNKDLEKFMGTCSGTYPNQCTISHTFDTDSDYVRVPYQNEINAVFINSRPEISVLTAHASDVPIPVRSYASPAVFNSCASRGPGNPNVLGVPLPPVPDYSRNLKNATDSDPSALTFPNGFEHHHQQQLEQFKEQLYSDVDYVIYPLKDPIISRQEYADARHSSLMAAVSLQALPAPPPYRPPRTESLNRPPPPVPPFNSSSACSSYSSSSLNLSSAPESAYCSPAPSCIGFYQQGLSASSLSLSGSSVSHNAYGYGYETASYSTGSECTASSHSQAGSYDPIHSEQQYLDASGIYSDAGSIYRSKFSNPRWNQNYFNLSNLREQSKALDLPLLTALCNDRALLSISSVPSNIARPGKLVTKNYIPNFCGKLPEKKKKPVTLPKAKNSYNINSPKHTCNPSLMSSRPSLSPSLTQIHPSNYCISATRWPLKQTRH